MLNEAAEKKATRSASGRHDRRWDVLAERSHNPESPDVKHGIRQRGNAPAACSLPGLFIIAIIFRDKKHEPDEASARGVMNSVNNSIAVARPSSRWKDHFVPWLAAALFLLTPVDWAVASGTDRVQLTDGTVLRGQVVDRSEADELLMAVQRRWLEAREPALAREASDADTEQTVTAWRQLSDRLDALLASPLAQQNDPLRVFLQREQTRIQQLLAVESPPPFQFLWLRIPKRSIRAVTPADPAWRRLLQWGWQEQLDDVETLPQNRLATVLTKAGIDAAQQPPSLVDRLPPLPQSDDQWQARLALLQHTYGAPVSFQGTGDVLVRLDEAAPEATLLPMITQLLQAEVSNLLVPTDQPHGHPAMPAAPPEDRWVQSARAQAIDDGRFRATRVTTNLTQHTVVVESRFEVLTTPDHWATIWRDRSTVDARNARPDAEARITADPRVEQALAGLRLLGLTDDHAITTAIRFGAATMEAQDQTNQRFIQFCSDHTRQLDSPPLVISP